MDRLDQLRARQGGNATNSAGGMDEDEASVAQLVLPQRKRSVLAAQARQAEDEDEEDEDSDGGDDAMLNWRAKKV